MVVIVVAILAVLVHEVLTVKMVGKSMAPRLLVVVVVGIRHWVVPASLLRAAFIPVGAPRVNRAAHTSREQGIRPGPRHPACRRKLNHAMRRAIACTTAVRGTG